MTLAPHPLTRVHWHHPEWVAMVVAASGWLAVSVPAATEPALLLRSVHASGVAVLAHAALMAAAMMGPLVLANVHDLAGSSLWRRRYRAVLAYLAGYLGLWTVVGAAMMLALDAVLPITGPVPLVVVLGAVVVLFAGSAAHRRHLRRCSATRPLVLTGWRADRDCVEEGIRTGWQCVQASWPVMLAVMASGGLLVLAAGAAYLFAERSGRIRDQRLTPWALALVEAAVLAALAAHALSMSGVPLPAHTGH